MGDWGFTNGVNIFGASTLAAFNMMGVAEGIQVVVTILGVGALAWFNIERAISERKKRKGNGEI